MHPLSFPTSLKICDPTKLRGEEIRNVKKKFCVYWDVRKFKTNSKCLYSLIRTSIYVDSTDEGKDLIMFIETSYYNCEECINFPLGFLEMFLADITTAYRFVKKCDAHVCKYISLLWKAYK